MDYKGKLEELVLTVIREGGSDLHLGAGRMPAIRVAGELIFLLKHEPLSSDEVFGMLVEILGKEKTEKFKENR